MACVAALQLFGAHLASPMTHPSLRPLLERRKPGFFCTLLNGTDHWIEID